jgi:hypothetical protein
LAAKGVDILMFMRDANNEDWRDVQDADRRRCPPQYQHVTVFAVCQRNVECWICAAQDWIANRLGGSPSDFRVEDPKGVFESRMSITSRERREAEIAEIVKVAPLKRWLENRSFEAFYSDVWQLSKNTNCSIENIRDASR